jgi:hypothetical protein
VQINNTYPSRAKCVKIVWQNILTVHIVFRTARTPRPVRNQSITSFILHRRYNIALVIHHFRTAQTAITFVPPITKFQKQHQHHQLHTYPENGSSTFLRKLGIYLPKTGCHIPQSTRRYCMSSTYTISIQVYYLHLRQVLRMTDNGE